MSSNFSQNDFLADIDASNLAYYYDDKFLSVSMEKYFTYSEKQRVQLFVKSYGNGDFNKGLEELKRRAQIYLIEGESEIGNTYLNEEAPIEYKEVVVETFIEHLESYR